MAANEDKLSALHTKLAEVLSDALDGTEIPGDIDEETGEVQTHRIPASAAIMTVAAKFLKDNNVTCTPSKDNALGELEDKLKEARDKRAARRASASDKEAATKDMGFMAGLPN